MYICLIDLLLLKYTRYAHKMLTHFKIALHACKSCCTWTEYPVIGPLRSITGIRRSGSDLYRVHMYAGDTGIHDRDAVQERFCIASPRNRTHAPVVSRNYL